MDDLGIKIFNKTRKVTMPNPLYQEPQYNKSITMKGKWYPDLSIQENQELDIYTIETQFNDYIEKATNITKLMEK